MDSGLLLVVQDDGVGFDRTHPRERKHLGLASMHERVQLVNGTLDIESAAGKGTTVVAWVPAQGEVQRTCQAARACLLQTTTCWWPRR